jgi:hypothetical protein
VAQIDKDQVVHGFVKKKAGIRVENKHVLDHPYAYIEDENAVLKVHVLIHTSTIGIFGENCEDYPSTRQLARKAAGGTKPSHSGQGHDPRPRTDGTFVPGLRGKTPGAEELVDAWRDNVRIMGKMAEQAVFSGSP